MLTHDVVHPVFARKRGRSFAPAAVLLVVLLAMTVALALPAVSQTSSERVCSMTYVRSTPMWDACVSWRDALARGSLKP